MGALPPGTVRVMPCLGDPHLEVCHFFQKSLGLGEVRAYLQALRLKEHLDGGYQVAFGNINAFAIPVHLLASRDRNWIEKKPFLPKQVRNRCSNPGVVYKEEVGFEENGIERCSSLSYDVGVACPQIEPFKGPNLVTCRDSPQPFNCGS